MGRNMGCWLGCICTYHVVVGCGEAAARRQSDEQTLQWRVGAASAFSLGVARVEAPTTGTDVAADQDLNRRRTRHRGADPCDGNSTDSVARGHGTQCIVLLPRRSLNASLFHLILFSCHWRRSVPRLQCRGGSQAVMFRRSDTGHTLWGGGGRGSKTRVCSVCLSTCCSGLLGLIWALLGNVLMGVSDAVASSASNWCCERALWNAYCRRAAPKVKWLMHVSRIRIAIRG